VIATTDEKLDVLPFDLERWRCQCADGLVAPQLAVDISLSKKTGDAIFAFSCVESRPGFFPFLRAVFKVGDKDFPTVSSGSNGTGA
jgi:hypothetical protein